MTIDLTTKVPLTGTEFIESLRDGREIYIDGDRIADITTHPAYATSIRSIARLYDSMHDPDSGMKTVPTDTGNGGFTHPYFKVPRSAQDLLDSRDAIAHWAKLTYGWMGRTPDYKASFLGTLGANADYYGEYSGNAQRWYRDSQEQMLYWNHAIINPPIDRNLPLEDIQDVIIHVERETDNGVVISGAKVVATGSAMTHSSFIAHIGAPVRDKRFAIIAAVPMDTPGVKLISRTSYAQNAARSGGPFDYPLSQRFDENDAILIFDQAEIPWENVFLYGDLDAFNSFGPRAGFVRRMSLHGTTRLAVKLDFIAGLLLKSLKLTGTKEFYGIQSRIGEVLAWRSALWALTDQMARNPEQWVNGAVQPNNDAVQASRWLGMVAYPRIREIILQDLGSALIYLPSNANDFKSEAIRPYLDKYVRGSGGIGSEERVKTLKLLWDAVGTEFGGRHELYERNYQGSHEHVRQTILWDYDATGMSQKLEDFAEQAMSEYDLDGWTIPGLDV